MVPKYYSFEGLPSGVFHTLAFQPQPPYLYFPKLILSCSSATPESIKTPDSDVVMHIKQLQTLRKWFIASPKIHRGLEDPK